MALGDPGKPQAPCLPCPDPFVTQFFQCRSGAFFSAIMQS